MMQTMLNVFAALLLCYAGMTALCLAMDRHHNQVLRRAPAASARQGFRWAGWLLLALAVVPCAWAWGLSIGVIAWFGFLSAGALALVFMLPYGPRFAAMLGAGSVVASLLMMLIVKVST
ncbi:DUF3325 domain-containing protein [Azoarcus sp. TTM-91]|uniref:DUF3325 domain-containing protein n=1 Tax=Azoarcus sp. TTM-91 TaxID=2691581 RepID=UPI001B7D0DEF|nr:DUF3325 domain-containing protein [Azoarcus sp. TTM-91]